MFNRGFRIVINKTSSNLIKLDHSVSQGSCVPVQCCILCTQVHIIRNKFTAGNNDEELNSVTSLVDCLASVNEWMKENRLRMNPYKTEYILFGSRQQLVKCNTRSMNIGGVDLQRASCIKYLWTTFGHVLSLNFKERIVKKCIVATINLYRIIRIRSSLTEAACKMWLYRLWLSHTWSIPTVF